jgi:hypothetical protein
LESGGMKFLALARSPSSLPTEAFMPLAPEEGRKARLESPNSQLDLKLLVKQNTGYLDGLPTNPLITSKDQDLF